MRVKPCTIRKTKTSKLNYKTKSADVYAPLRTVTGMCSNASSETTEFPRITTIPIGVFSDVVSFTASSSTRFKN